jgi:hypothetical protein
MLIFRKTNIAMFLFLAVVTLATYAFVTWGLKVSKKQKTEQYSN